MARTGLSKSEVRQARDRLLAEGRYPSVDAVRQALGGVGSKSTIHRFLKELREEGPDAAIRREDSAGALHALVEQLAERLHADAERRIQALRAQYEQALREALREKEREMERDKERELAALRSQVASLAARLGQLQDEASFAPRAAGPGARLADGFGRADRLLLDARSGAGSPFAMVRSFARSEVVGLDRLWRADGPPI